MRKPSPGVCGYCGAPVIRGNQPASTTELSPHGRKWISGHLCEDVDGVPKLIRVRCRDHAEEFADPLSLDYYESLGALEV